MHDDIYAIKGVENYCSPNFQGNSIMERNSLIRSSTTKLCPRDYRNVNDSYGIMPEYDDIVCGLSNLWHLSLHSVNFEQRRDRDVMQLDHEREKVSAGGKNKRLDRASLAYHTEWWRPLTKIFIPLLIWGPDTNRLCLGGLIEIETNIKPALFIHVKDE